MDNILFLKIHNKTGSAKTLPTPHIFFSVLVSYTLRRVGRQCVHIFQLHQGGSLSTTSCSTSASTVDPFGMVE